MTGRRLDRRASWTAQVCAAQRAAESLQPSRSQRLDDPYSHHFVAHPALKAALIHPLTARAFIRILDRHSPDLHTFIVLRVRYAEDVYRAANNDGVDQIVLLGAGFDTTSLRWAGPPVTIFEVDAPSTLTDKRLVVDRVLPETSNAKAVWVPCDFEHDKLRERLLESGLDPTRPSVVAWIGVTMYLTRDAIAATLANLAVLCAPRSQLIFDYVDPDVVTGQSRWPGARRVARAVARRGEPYRTGFEPADIEAFIAEYGFTCQEHARTPALLQRYAPTAGNSSAANDWLAICTARRN